MRVTYDKISPFSGNKRVMIEPDGDKRDNLMVCMDTGYHTYEDNWKIDSDVIDIVETTFPAILTASRKEGDGNYWYKLMLITPFVMLMPEVVDETPVWAIYALRDGNPIADEIVMEVESVDGSPLYRAIDSESRAEFPDGKFELAMDAFQQVGAAVYGKIFDMATEA